MTGCIASVLFLQGVSSLAASCAALCVQHCAKLQAAEGRETTVLDIGCGTGGCCFELAAR
jgi:cyclopropane fatty-acyl-phospholipid synthase-like methyltransferase